MHMRGRAIRAATSTFSALLVSCALFAPVAGAVAGQPDPTFGNNGFALLDEPSFTDDALNDVLVLPDGKILGGGARGGASGSSSPGSPRTESRISPSAPEASGWSLTSTRKEARAG